MKRLFVPILLFSTLAIKAQQPQPPAKIVTIKVTVQQANLILQALGDRKLSEGIDIYLSIYNQVQGQLSTPPTDTTANAKKDSIPSTKKTGGKK